MIALALPNLSATSRLATLLAPLLADGDVVELVGEMGAGKTTFVGLLARSLGATEPARSPTYTVAHLYALEGGRQLAHLDLYRTPGEMDEASWGDLEPYFESSIACVEWPAPIRPWLRGRPTWRLELAAPSTDARAARLHPPHDWSAAALADAVSGGWA